MTGMLLRTTTPGNIGAVTVLVGCNTLTLRFSGGCLDSVRTDLLKVSNTVAVVNFVAYQKQK